MEGSMSPFHFYFVYYSMDTQVIKIIREINEILLRCEKESITPEDFDTLYDMDIDELIQAKLTILNLCDHSKR